MALKVKTIKLRQTIDHSRSTLDPAPAGQTGYVKTLAYHYKVEQLTDSIEFKTGDFISPETVQELCENKNWKVTVI